MEEVHNLRGPAAGQEVASPFESQVKFRFGPPHWVQLVELGGAGGSLLSAPFCEGFVAALLVGGFLCASWAPVALNSSNMKIDVSVIVRCIESLLPGGSTNQRRQLPQTLDTSRADIVPRCF